MDRSKITRQPSSPGEILQVLFMEPLGLSTTDLAERLEVTVEALTKIINGKSPMTVDMAMRLGTAFGNRPEVWINAQINLDLWKARQGDQAWRHIRPLVKQEPLAEEAC